MQLARYMLKNEGLPKLGTDSKTSRDQARASVEQARTYYLDLTSELKEKEQAALVQEAWVGAAQAEEPLVGLPTTDGGTDSRGEVDKAIKYYQQAGSIFPDTEFSNSRCGTGRDAQEQQRPIRRGAEGVLQAARASHIPAGPAAVAERAEARPA